MDLAWMFAAIGQRPAFIARGNDGSARHLYKMQQVAAKGSAGAVNGAVKDLNRVCSRQRCFYVDSCRKAALIESELCTGGSQQPNKGDKAWIGLTDNYFTN